MLILKTITMMRDSVRFIISYVLITIIISSLLSSCGNKIETEQYRASPELAECFINLNGNTAGLSDDKIAGFEDYRIPAGVMENDTLRITLEARAAEWHPWGEDGPAIYTHVFAADGEAPKIPGPLIRFTAGTPVQVTVRNTLPDTLAIRGLRDQARGGGLPGVISDQMIVPPSGEAKHVFTSTLAGTFSYGADRLSVSVEPDTPLPGAAEADRGFRGLLIVDEPDETIFPDERFFLLTHWADRNYPATYLPATRFFINGGSWPHTERLNYAQGDTVRWRVVNFTGRNHPMHLHGFYFNVDARGDLFTDRVYPPEDRRTVVTEMLAPAETMRMSWVAHEPGNWVFHCHFMRHMSWIQTSPIDGPPPSHAHDSLADADLMGGLVLGVSVQPEEDWAPDNENPRKQLDLYINKKAGVFGEDPGYAFLLKNEDEPPASDSLTFPGSPIILTRDEPTEITIHNQADVPLGVHWHGLELESWSDGVPEWSGMPGSVIPAVQPGSSISVRMTPPRSGTFMYHVHSEPGHQLAQGLYGPFLVMEPGGEWNPETDRFFILGSLGSGDDPPAAVNGETEPGPMDLTAGETYRLRFMHISPDDDKRVFLLNGDNPVEWKYIAKDGADLPPNQVRFQPAELDIHVGETYDFRWTPEEPGQYTLRIVTTFDRGAPAFPREAPGPHVAEVGLRVSD
jgi:manganese oxidase